MMDRFKTAALDGALVGVKILAALAVVLLGAGWVFGDYNQTRSNASAAVGVLKVICQNAPDACKDHPAQPPAQKPEPGK